MVKDDAGSAIGHLLNAAALIESAPDAEPWDYGWGVESYRRSGNASLSSKSGPVKMSLEGVGEFEAAAIELLKKSAIRERYDSEEFWGILAGIVASLAGVDDVEEVVRRRVERLLSAPPSLVVFPVANIKWEGSPLTFGKQAVIGLVDDEFVSEAVRLGNLRAKEESKYGEERRSSLAAYAEKISDGAGKVGCAVLVTGQERLAFEQAREFFESVVDLSLLLDEDRFGHQLFSLRGAVNRPGVMGIALDRGVVAERFESAGAKSQLLAQPLIIDRHGAYGKIFWHSADPVPLAILLRDSGIRSTIEWALPSNSPIARRLRVAARWFSESHWASSAYDSALSLGVALDALIGSKSGLPGRVMRQRFALLDPSASRRPERAKRYDDVYSARSAVAHGGESSELKYALFVRGVQDDVTWASWRLLKMQGIFAPKNDRDFDKIFDDLVWGTISWPDETAEESEPGAASATVQGPCNNSI